ncbi:retrovirus-related Pol polyprotein from transposon 412 [Trichonephila clavipes]|nr:retrovirus-related Pol polyprotein from transposon 412 [Trichonephila clavipes]
MITTVICISALLLFTRRGISGSASHPTEKGDAFPTPGRRQCTHKYIMVNKTTPGVTTYNSRSCNFAENTLFSAAYNSISSPVSISRLSVNTSSSESGIGDAQVTTIGSFEHEFKIDDENYSLTWHVVPDDKLKFEAVIGSDLLEQASISFTKEGVKFNKYENHAQLMQISAENLQEELDLRHVENRQIKKELEKLIQDYKPEKTASTDVTMRIILKDEEQVCQPPRRLAFTERQEVNKQIEEWLNEGIIRPSSSEYASPIVMVKKKDGSSKMCIDYRKLDQKLVKDKFPLPIIEDVLDTLQEAKVYSTLDLRNSFFHVDVDEDCRKYTSFFVPDGQFEFNKVPFGLSTSPGVFQRYVSSIFKYLTQKGIVISYLDDLVIPAKNEQEGL